MRKILGYIADYIRETEKILLIICITAASYGSILVLSSTLPTGSSHKFIVQCAGLILGVIVAVIISTFDYKTFQKSWAVIAVFAFILVGLTFAYGYTPAGSDDKAWLLLPGNISLQPSEILKIAFIITFAHHVSKIKPEKISSFLNIILLCAHGAVPVFLIHLQGDDGTAVVIFLIFLSMFFASGIKYRYFIAAGFMSIIAAPIMWFQILQDWQKNRILILFNPDLDPLGIGWQQGRAEVAMGSGGLFGQGLFKGPYVQSESIPKGYNDFIFASAGEELGFLGCMGIIILISAICIRIIMISRLSRDKAGMIMCVGVFGMIAFQALLNIGMCLSLLPVIGITLPFFSAGGTSVTSLFLGIGVVLSVYKSRHKRVLHIRE